MNDIQLYLAPFQGITSNVYREIYTQHFDGIDKLFTAFFSSIHKWKIPPAKSIELAQTHHHGVRVIPQILSKDADEMLRFAQICADKGFEEINWNLGCPFPRVAHKKRGSGMLPYPEMVQEILDRLMPCMPVKFSIKCRLGYESPEEIQALLPVFAQFPLSELIVHARIGKQLYKGPVDLTTFEKIADKVASPLIYNGDIFSPDEFLSIQQRFQQINRWMLGRGLLTNPFLPATIKGIPLPEEPKILIRKFVDDLYFAYRHKMNDRLQSINVMKEMWSYLALSFDNPTKVFGKIKKCKSFDTYEDTVNLVFEKYQWMGSGGKR